MKRKNSHFDVTGKSVNDLLNLSYNEINRMSVDDLAEVTKRLVSAANKRLRRAESTPKVTRSNAKKVAGGTLSPAYKAAMENGLKHRKDHRFSIKGKKTQGDLKRELTRIKRYMNDNTSGNARFNSYRKKMNKKYGIPVDLQKSIDFWTLADKVRQTLPIFGKSKNYMSEQLFTKLDDYMTKNGSDLSQSDYDGLIDELRDLYEESSNGGYEVNKYVKKTGKQKDSEDDEEDEDINPYGLLL